MAYRVSVPTWQYVGYGNKRLCDNVLRLESLEQDLGELVAQYPHNRELARLPKVLAKQVPSLVHPCVLGSILL